jgi:hypothetical protein
MEVRRARASLENPVPYDGHMPELVFEVVQEADGGYCAECLTENIFTQARRLGAVAEERARSDRRVLL